METRPTQVPQTGRDKAPATPEPGADQARPTTPFATMPRIDIVRDAVALVCVALTLVLPWDFAHRGTQRIEVVLSIALVAAACALPFIARVGVLPERWTVHTTRRVRLFATAPFIVVALVYLVLDAVQGDTVVIQVGAIFREGGLGAGFAVGLAAAVLVAAPRESELGPPDQDGAVGSWWSVVLAALAAAAGVVVLLTVIFTVTADGAATEQVVRAFVYAAFVVTLAILCGPGILAKHESARLTLVGLGTATGGALVATGTMLGTGEGMHYGGCGLVLVPALGAVAAAAPLRRVMADAPTASVWMAMARRSIDILLAVTGYCAVLGFLMLTGDDGRTLALGIGAAGVLCLAITVAVRTPMAKDPVAGRPLALVAMAAVAAVGTTSLFILGGAHRTIAPPYVLMAVGVPAMVAWALAGPQAVRAYVNQERRAAKVPEKAYVWSPPEPKTVRGPKATAGAAASDAAVGPGKAATDRAGTAGAARAGMLKDGRPGSARVGSAKPGSAKKGLGRPGTTTKPGPAETAGSSARPRTGSRDKVGRPDSGRSRARHPESVRLDGSRPDDGRVDVGRLDGGRTDGGRVTAVAGSDRTSGLDHDTVPGQGPRITGTGTSVTGAAGARAAGAGQAPGTIAAGTSAAPDDVDIPTHAIPIAQGRANTSHRVLGAAAGADGVQDGVALEGVALEVGGSAASPSGVGGSVVDLSGDTIPGGYVRFEPPASRAYPVAADNDTTGPAVPAGRFGQFTATQALDPTTPLEVLAQIAQDAPHLRPKLAANPSTYPALLEWLGNLGDPAVDAALRSRP